MRMKRTADEAVSRGKWGKLVNPIGKSVKKDWRRG